MIGDDLYKCGYGQSLLKCVTAEQAQYIIKELHEGICGYHSRAHHDYPNPSRRLLLANHGGQLPRNKNIFILYYRRGLSQSGEWTSSAPSPPVEAK